MDEQGRTEDIFEREWREAFDGAQQEPPRIVWSEIDRALAHDKVLLFKRKSIYYRWAAAAIFLLATTIGFFQLVSSSNSYSRTIAEIEVDNPQLANNNTRIEVPENATGGAVGNLSSNRLFASNQSSGKIDRGGMPPSNALLIDENLYDLRSKSELIVIEAIKPASDLPSVDVVDRLYRVASMLNARKAKNESLDEKYWAGVDFSSGTFDPNFQSSGTSLLDNSLAFNSNAQFSATNTEALDAGSPDVRENMQAGQTVSFGMNMGLKLSDKWTVQSGFQYMKADATNNTNVVVTTTRLVDPIAATSQFKKVSQVRSATQADEVVEYNYEDVDLRNVFQFASIPVKAGYKLLDSRFSLELKAGVAANLYLGNKITDPDNQLAEVTIGPGSNSPYKELSFMGLAGVQFGYEFVKNFNIVIEPNYRRSLDNMTKNSSEFEAAPSSFGLQTGIRYQFN
ncbi:MAG: hypothetical protein ABJN36_13855 [Cyclobacteriaceae bacterium]